MKRERVEPKICKNVFTPIHHPFLFSSHPSTSYQLINMFKHYYKNHHLIFFFFWYFHSFIYLVTPQQLRPKQTTDSSLKLTKERQEKKKLHGIFFRESSAPEDDLVTRRGWKMCVEKGRRKLIKSLEERRVWQF